MRELDTDIRELSALADALLRLGEVVGTTEGAPAPAAPDDVAAVLTSLHERAGEPTDVGGLPASWSLGLPRRPHPSS